MSSFVELIETGPEHQSCVENLLELYIHDFSEFVPVDVKEDGRFGYPDLPLYWHEPCRKAFLARVEGKLAGFALVTRGLGLSGDSEVWDMAEFFVLRRHRHHGVGAELAQRIWRLHPGMWQVRVRTNNVPALRFWESAITKFAESPATLQDSKVQEVAWKVFSFQSPTNQAPR
jgi:predicted acetyltransferase